MLVEKGNNRPTTPANTTRRLRVLVVTGAYPTPQRPHSGTFIKSQMDSLRDAGIEVEVIHPEPGPVLLRYISAIAQIRARSRSGQFDLIHAHYGQWCLFACMQARLPVVASFLGDDLLGTVTASGKFNVQGMLITRLSRWLCSRVNAAIVKSAEMKRAAGRADVYVIPNGVDFSLFRPLPRAQVRAELGWSPDRAYVLFGNNPTIPVKNFPLARAAIDLLQAKGHDVELVVANGLPQPQLVSYINACNVIILSSRAEGSPNIVKEAMACNVPVVATRVGDVADVIGRTSGCYVTAPTPQALAAAIEDALTLQQPTTGRRDIAHLERSLVAQQVIAVYERVLTSTAGTGNAPGVKAPTNQFQRNTVEEQCGKGGKYLCAKHVIHPIKF